MEAVKLTEAIAQIRNFSDANVVAAIVNGSLEVNLELMDPDDIRELVDAGVGRAYDTNLGIVDLRDYLADNHYVTNEDTLDEEGWRHERERLKVDAKKGKNDHASLNPREYKAFVAGVEAGNTAQYGDGGYSQEELPGMYQMWVDGGRKLEREE